MSLISNFVFAHFSTVQGGADEPCPFVHWLTTRRVLASHFVLLHCCADGFRAYRAHPLAAGIRAALAPRVCRAGAVHRFQRS